jgi:AbrB family looped-hinge helix DNA binding protein
MEGAMSTVTVSPKFQVVIPRQVREEFDIRPGEKVQVFVYEGRIELVPVRPLRRLRGFVRGIDTSVEREEDRA